MSMDADKQPLTMREIELLRRLDRQADVVDLQSKIIAKLEARIAMLERDSDNSNQPPSGDPPFKTRPGSGKNGKPGAKPGHKAYQRTPFPPERVDETKIHDFPEGDAPSHLTPFVGENAWMDFQQITRLKAVVTQHRVRRYFDTLTGEVVLAPHPKGLGKLLAPETAAAVAWLKTKGHMAIASMRDFFRDILDVKVSAGCLSQAVTETGRAAKQAWAEVRLALLKERVVGFDETSHWDLGWRSLWMWVAQTTRLSLFRIGESRSADELDDLLPPGWSGVMVRDAYAAYFKWEKGKPGISNALCLAHLSRDIQSLLCHPNLEISGWGLRLQNELGGLWDAYQLRHKQLMWLAWSRFMRAVRATPFHADAERLAKRLKKHEASYTRFIEDEEVPPTNNGSEQALRQVVIHRKITQGTRGNAGMDAQERIWTVLDTARKQGLSTLRYMRDAIDALRAGLTPPAFLRVAATCP